MTTFDCLEGTPVGCMNHMRNDVGLDGEVQEDCKTSMKNDGFGGQLERPRNIFFGTRAAVGVVPGCKKLIHVVEEQVVVEVADCSGFDQLAGQGIDLEQQGWEPLFDPS